MWWGGWGGGEVVCAGVGAGGVWACVGGVCWIRSVGWGMGGGDGRGRSDRAGRMEALEVLGEDLLGLEVEGGIKGSFDA